MEDLLNKISTLKIKKPICLKISPDINSKDISQIIELIRKFNIDGLIISNTTISKREKLEDSKKFEEGGLSGEPLKNMSTNIRFLPNLKKVTFKSEKLNKNIRLSVSNSALRTVDFKGGLDKFLKTAKNKNLSKRVKKIKISIVSKS